MISSIFNISAKSFGRCSALAATLLGAAAILSPVYAGSNTNTDLGLQALAGNTQGFYDTAIGLGALNQNTTGSRNTAVGAETLRFNTTGSYNSGSGSAALISNTLGNYNTGDGEGALFHNTTGSNNIALGYLAGEFLTIGDYNIDIGNTGVADEGHTIRIGDEDNQTKTFIAGINGAGVSGMPVVVNNLGQLGVAVSSARFKQDVKPMEKASEAILALKPVTFRYKEQVDSQQTPQFGLIAEEVEKVNPDLIVRDEHGNVLTVRYDAVNAMLLNEFLKEHRKVEEQTHKNDQQQATIDRLESIVSQQQKQIENLNAGLQKVRVAVELNHFARTQLADSP